MPDSAVNLLSVSKMMEKLVVREDVKTKKDASGIVKRKKCYIWTENEAASEEYEINILVDIFLV